MLLSAVTASSTTPIVVIGETSTTVAAADETSATLLVNSSLSCVVDESSTQESLTETANEPSLCTMDLIKFSFQCVNGMAYIASRKLVHRDLAARNVLLTKDNIIKICDFGLTRDEFYLCNNMKKSALPIRWMAPESIGQNQFTTKSDVTGFQSASTPVTTLHSSDALWGRQHTDHTKLRWQPYCCLRFCCAVIGTRWSFGIFLWEMFMLGDNPYAGMTIDHDFYQKIFRGYRLTPPQTTPKPVFKLMLECWQTEPGERPHFTEIVDRFSSLLEEQEKNYYLRLNAPYEEANRRDSQNTDDSTSAIHSDCLLESLFQADD